MTDDSFEVRGTEAFQQLGKALKSAEDGKELRKELLRELRGAGKPIIGAVRHELGSKMPQRGGLAAHLAKARVATRNKLSGQSAGVQIQTSVKGYDLQKIEAGQVRHPVWGHGPWVSQSVEANVISDAIESKTPVMRDAVLDAIDHVLEELTRKAT